MNMCNIVFVKCFLILLGSHLIFSSEESIGIQCPLKCSCLKANTKLQSSNKLYKLKCGGEVKLSSIDEIDFLSFSSAKDIVNLDLSGNNLTYIPADIGLFSNLQKLDLNKNHITQIENGAFQNMSSLKRLDISSNKIRRLNREMFEGLRSLERLKLNQNFISQIKEGTFDALVSLKQIDLSNNPLICDCSLWWLLEWVRNSSVKFSPLPKCSGPPSLRGQPLRKLKVTVTDPHCDWPEHEEVMTGIELRPDQNQVVFEGDSLRLQCRAVDISPELDLETVVIWSWSGMDPSDIFQQSVSVRNKHLKDSGLVESLLMIDAISTNHSGEWNCLLVSNQGNHSNSISVIVISNHTQYCPLTVTSNNKGIYNWPKTVFGNTVELQCAIEGETGYSKAMYTCSDDGKWQDLDTSGCPYSSETTRVLEQFSKVNVSSKGSVLESARRFHNFTTNETRQFSDKMDIIFISSTIENYLTFEFKENELAELIVDVVSAVMKQPQSVLLEAQKSASACSKLVSAVETVAEFTPKSNKPNMVFWEDSVSRENFLGMTCTWFSHSTPEGIGRWFNCVANNNTGFPGTKKKIVEASIQVPASLFYNLEAQGIMATPSPQLMVAMYDNGHLFPRIVSTNHSREVTSCVVGSKLVGVDVGHLNDPVYVFLRPGGEVLSGSPLPAWWDPVASEWKEDGCQLSELLNGLLVFKCHRLGYFALLQDTNQFGLSDVKVPRAKSRLTHPAIYFGTFIGATCLVVATFTYAVCYRTIQMCNKAKHSLANTWLAIALLCFVFSLGIYQTEDVVLCQIIGLLIHYLTLCSLFWMAVSIKTGVSNLQSQAISCL